jgi:hypothetical protein
VDISAPDVGEREVHHVQREDLLILADRFEVGPASKVLGEVRKAVTAWPEFAGRARVSQSAHDRIQSHHTSL